MPESGLAIEARALSKRYGEVRALDGFDLAVPYGTVHGLLGPNGAGKTTAVRILTTLLRLTAARRTSPGVDVAARPAGGAARGSAWPGSTPPSTRSSPAGRTSSMFGRLFHLGRRRAKLRATELLEQFDLADAGDKGVEEYSGGMRRRLDLARRA